MNFFVLTALAVLACIFAVALAVLIPRKLYSGLLRGQIRLIDGHVFTPDSKTWQSYLAKASPLGSLVTLILYAGLLTVFIFFDAGSGPLAACVTFGVYLLLRHMLQMLPPTYGITGKGVTVISWLPNFPLGPFGSGSVYIPWTAVEVCAIDNLFFTVLTEKQEARVVYPPEIEDKVCSFIDSLLRRRGYETNTVA